MTAGIFEQASARDFTFSPGNGYFDGWLHLVSDLLNVSTTSSLRCRHQLQVWLDFAVAGSMVMAFSPTVL
jgi:hypothetical protein